MAKLFTGILGSGRGKVANVVMGRWKGIDYIRAYAVPANPRTEPQVQNRSKFSTATKKASVFTDYLRLLPNLVPKKSNFNLIVSDTFKGTGLLEAVAKVGEGEPAFSSITLDKTQGRVRLSGDMVSGDRIVLAVGNTGMLAGTSEEKAKVYEATVSSARTVFEIDTPLASNAFGIATIIRANKARTGVFTSLAEIA